MSQFDRARLRGELEAQRELAAIALEPGEKIDIFEAIERAGVWLMFSKMDSLFGLYRRENHTPGIIINSQHPAPLQRFTAAHEYGHHVLGHEHSLDNEESIYRTGPSNSLQEVEAYAFGASLLMPVQTVEWHLRRLHHGTLGGPTPDDAYALSVELGVSYAAMVGQLVALGLISPIDGRSFKKIQPLELKTKILGRRPENARAGVWRLSEADAGRHIHADPADEILVELPETASSGYRWQLAEVGGSLETLTGEEAGANSNTQTDDCATYGSEHTRVFRFRVRAGGTTTCSLSCRRAWPGASSEASQTMSFRVVPAPQRVGESGHGISLLQQPQLLAQAA